MAVHPIPRRALLRIAGLSVAAVPFFARAVSAAGLSEATAPIERLNAALLKAMKAGRNTPFTERYNMLAPVVEQAFDLDTVLRVSVGPHWAALAPDQQAQLEAAFRRYTIATYAANFDDYSGQKFEIVPQTRGVGANEQVVTTRVVPSDGSAPSTLGYVMRQTASGWKAVDVLADGSISRVATQRSDFRSVLTSGGGSALVASLQRKVATLSGGALA
jgi:phospholipid transport system substrate-binding protein